MKVMIVFGAVACGAPEIAVEAPLPMRVVAIGPAVADVVHRLRPDALVAIDDASAERKELASLPKVGFSRGISAEGVLSVGPTHVLLTERAGPAEAIEQLRAAGVEVAVIPHDRSPKGVRAVTLAVSEVVDRNPASLLTAFDVTCKGIVPATDTRAMFIYARGLDTMSVSGTGTAGAAMLEMAGLTNAVVGVEGYKPLTPEAVVEADPDVLVFTTKGLEALGGKAALAAVPGLSLTKAVKAGRVAAVDDLALLAFGLDACEGASALADQAR